ncbi:MAG: DUF1109 domain-containing protein [Sphingomicrobium sp.]
MSDFNLLIDELTATMVPVRPLSLRRGAALFAAVAAISVAAGGLILGLRPDIVQLRPDDTVLMSIGLFAVLGLACAGTVVRMARPGVGRASDGWRWALAAMLVLPVVAAIEAILFPALRIGIGVEGSICLARGLVAAVASAAAATWWLRRGAPVRIETASWLVGLGAGSVGALAVAISCPDDALAHIGLWHGAIIPVAGGLSRLVLPRFLRW